LRNLGPLDAESAPTTPTPAVFERALAGLAAVELRPELDREQLPAPRRLASYSYAGSVAVLGPADPGAEAEELGSGRFVLLYEPDGHPEWQGVFRCVTLVQVDLETEIAEDRLLPEVAWSWLTEAFQHREAHFTVLGGTVSQCASTRFGDLARSGSAGPGPGAAAGPGSGLGAGSGPGGTALSGTGPSSVGSRGTGPQPIGAAGRPPGELGMGDLTSVMEPIEHSLELRASWTPVFHNSPSGRPPSPEDAYAAIQAHFQAWSDLLAAAAGLPPVLAAGVSSFPGGPRR
jgi:Protein of unknown function (DUF3000)